MNNSVEKKAGLALIVFTVLLVFTMGLHPSGGSVQRIIKITALIVTTHAIALLSLPFGWLGFWGLTKRLGTDRFWPVLGFAMISFGLVAVMLAASTNGLIMPIFLQPYKGANDEVINSIRPILKYSAAVNNAFDYIYTAAFTIAILCWSVAILNTRRLPVWIAWIGIVVSVMAIIVFGSGMAVNKLQGFRLFVAGIVGWVAVVGVVMYKASSSDNVKASD